MSFLRGGGRFARDRRAVTAIVFALCLLPMILMVGFAVDLGLQVNYKKKVQHALDMAGLAAARELNKNFAADMNTVQTLARAHFESELEGTDYISMEDVSVVRSGMRLNLDVEGTMPTSFMQLAGMDTMSLSTKSEAAFGVPTKAEVVLVLDTSHSMTKVDVGSSDSRIESLKTAASSMITTLVDPDSPVDIKMAIVPFSDRVNVGLDNETAAWLTGTDPETTTTETCVTDPAWKFANCSSTLSKCSNDGITYQCVKWDCHGKEPPAGSDICSTTTSTKVWHGCVKPRSLANHLTDANYSSEKIPGHVSPNEKQCASPMRPLTDNKDDLVLTLNNMAVRNETYIPTGLIWGYRMLTPATPFAAEKTIGTFAAEGGIKTIILMSDGGNTLKLGNNLGTISRIESHEVGTPVGDKTNEATNALCTSIKAAGVEIYVVAYGISDVATTTLLKNCASSESRFFEPTSTDQLQRVFEAITTQVGRDVSISG